MIGTKLRALAVSAALAVAAVPASAVTVTPFDTPLNAGDATLGNAVASANEDFGMTTLSFDAAEDLFADISITINPFLLSPGGIVSNSISLAYQVNGGSAIAVAVQTVSLPFGAVGAAGLGVGLDAGDVLSFIISGTAGRSGNQVTFAIETEPSAVPVMPAGLLALTGIGALSALRRRRKTA